MTSPGHKLFVLDGKDAHIAMKELENFIAKRRKYVQYEGSTKPLTFHGLRHAFADDAYQELISYGKSDRDSKKQVSRWLGHERGDVTNIYLAGLKRIWGNTSSHGTQERQFNHTNPTFGMVVQHIKRFI